MEVSDTKFDVAGAGSSSRAGDAVHGGTRPEKAEFGAHTDPPLQGARPKTEAHANNFDVLRLFFAVLVILSHSFIMIDGRDESDPLAFFFHGITLGHFAVDGFFMLSGYLIVQSWNMRPDPLAFMTKRVLRIYPGFMVAALISALVVGPLGADPAQYFSDLKVGQLIKSLLVLRVPAVPPVFEGLPFPVVNGSMWTIFFEFICYSLVLVLGVAGAIRARKAWLAATLLVFAAGIVQKTMHVFPEENFYLPIIRFTNYFFAGGCFYLFRDKLSFKPWAAFLCGLLVLVAISGRSNPDCFLAIVGGYLLFYIAFRPSPLLARFRRFPDVSYGTYLYGWPVQKLLLWYIPSIKPWALFPIACVISLGLGLLSWILVEKPFLDMKSVLDRWTGNRLRYE